jgi:uncharacterized membrane protein YeaQ/YmgE (transglycosylase-associated protein family)
MAILWWAIVGIIAGFLTGKIMSGAGYGILHDMVLGIVGAIVGGFLATQLGLASQGGLLYTIIVAVLGAMLVTFIVRKIRGSKT